jgi:predicted acylesterase/phospholipase RssA
MYNSISFSGGGVKSLSFIGVAKALNKYNILENIKHFYGTSGGSIIATLLYIGYDPFSLEKVILEFDLLQLTDITADNLLNFFNTYGIDSGEKFINIIKTLISFGLNKFYNFTNEDPTFLELYNLTKKNLNINAVCLNNREVEIFNHINTPNLSVIKAIRMSCSIPLLVKPVKYNEKYYVDGGLVENLIINKTVDEKSMLAFYISDNNNFLEITNLSQYLLSIVSVVIRNLNKKNYSCTNAFPIYLKNCSSIDFNIDNIKKKQIINGGYNEIINIINNGNIKVNLEKSISIINGKYKDEKGLFIEYVGKQSVKVKIKKKDNTDKIITIRKKNIVID